MTTNSELTRDAVSPAGDALADFAKQAQAGFELPAERLRGAGEGLKSDRDAISSAVRIAAVKRLIEGDPLLKKQLEDQFFSPIWVEVN